ncbi:MULTISPECIES: 2-amino-4-hydroxy-6-hydroxymethyldihydropteridine diphosphokinase [unclassified Acinetobacter]|uniref:2-amino-4-hydroxy-6- hydroxymethyldihydropteridine diphosphokinase n=1 Tax=unclassified Acinetobacter TaxID=196816 RepID=UPI001909A57A|nr:MULTISPECIES: 2-amino-4-hydroxy-6-hydroxymethyldihydropteridine diphosphokinase [unclassified Acinetobacter]MBK0063408.1 2-amino-4-hydroxy-6-hydroxymethyldihydropteridine diphosphokinase [Acinetobacter sp. S55]MBK0066680.1 2-amino-4-hydroxy-6-hydroxymethyldihydropteridine diphosphokinase [Acinetobacter sp. S54]
MNANETIFALALASNLNPEQHFQTAYQTIRSWGEVQFSHVYQIPCRDGVGADYWNSACLLKSLKTKSQIEVALKQLEAESARIRPSHHISLDIDLIAFGTDLNKMQFNPKKLPLALDVKIPLYELWPDPAFQVLDYYFPKFNFHLPTKANL